MSFVTKITGSDSNNYVYIFLKRVFYFSFLFISLIAFFILTYLRLHFIFFHTLYILSHILPTIHYSLIFIFFTSGWWCKSYFEFCFIGSDFSRGYRTQVANYRDSSFGNQQKLTPATRSNEIACKAQLSKLAAKIFSFPSICSYVLHSFIRHAETKN